MQIQVPHPSPSDKSNDKNNDKNYLQCDDGQQQHRVDTEWQGNGVEEVDYIPGSGRSLLTLGVVYQFGIFGRYWSVFSRYLPIL